MDTTNSKRVFKMIKLLRKNGKMKAADLVEELGLKTSRSITNYKVYIEKLGYNIKSTGGYYGGYELIEERLTDSEINEIAIKLDSIELIEKIKRINNRI